MGDWLYRSDLRDPLEQLIQRENASVCGIYKIEHIDSGKLYIGSSVNISGRWAGHRRDLKAKKHHSIKLQRAWDKYGADSFVFSVIEVVLNPAILIAREQFWIDSLGSYVSGYNSSPTAGNCLGVKHSDISKKNYGSTYRGKHLSEEHKAKIAESNKGKKRSIETCEKFSRIGKGRPVSLETRKKISEAHKGKIRSKEHSINLSKALTGKTLSESTREKLRIANIGRLASEETKKKMSESRMGRVVTEETRLKISIARNKAEYLRRSNNESKV